ncbi:dynamin family protein [Leptotrichia massiliensis]|uniref:dynamin family protein n=1 Tax=Leptotrichia massiliensis TaxID=1852388 RepID=UPI0028D7A4B2|nr:dynamin family protein [Leptotrichia massiliensis]
MEEKNFDLKDFRENYLKLTQSELAELMGIRQDRVSRLEKNLEIITPSELRELAKISGISMEKILDYEREIPKKLKFENKWYELQNIKKNIVENIKNFDLNENIEYSEYKNKLTEFRKNIEKIIRKPRVVFSGQSNSGKSTMINSLIGYEKMPIDWIPTTSIVVYVKDISDRPNYIEEELWIFKKEKEEEWDDTRLYDEKYCREWKIAGGSAELLKQYGTRKGNEYNDEIGSAVLFVDSPILKNCDILDVPGLVAGIESDNKAADKSKAKADILIYLSQASSFLRSPEDTNFLKDAIDTLQPLIKTHGIGLTSMSNLFIVATHADNIKPITKVKETFEEGFERFLNTLEKNFWKKYSDDSQKSLSKEDLKKRFFSYSINNEYLREKFEKELKNTIESIPLLLETEIFKALKEYIEIDVKYVNVEIERYNNLLNENKKTEKLVNEIERNEFKRKSKFQKNNKKVEDNIYELKIETKEIFKKKFYEILTEEYIVKAIDEKKYKNNKKDIEQLMVYINSEVKDALEESLKITTEKLKGIMDNYLSEIQKSFDFKDFSDTINVEFDYKSAFFAGLSGLGVFGGLSFWAAALGNLGGYILVAKGVSVLSALGISISGGTAAAISFVASIGGPVILAIAMSLLTVAAVFGIANGNWKKRIAKTIMKQFKENYYSEYTNFIDQFWNNTMKEFNEAKNSLEIGWKNYLEKVRKQLSIDPKVLSKYLKEVQKMKQFFSNILSIIKSSK